MEVKDNNGTLLKDGDSVIVIIDLKVMGSLTDLKCSKTIKNICLTTTKEEVDCRVDGSNIVLKTSFL